MGATIIVGISGFFIGYICATIMSTNTITELKDELEKRDIVNNEVHGYINKTFTKLGG